MQIEQTLHGYDDGHRLLASSVRLEPEEERSLDLLSDLSGYVPAGTDFTDYETGYPCGRFYVFARTWPDRMGKRSGTVFTHSLLLPREACAALGSLGALRSLFRLPTHPVDRLSYRTAPSWAPIETSEPLLAPLARRLLAAIWFGQDLRPLLWTDTDTAGDAAILLWSWLPPWLRARHTFCTFTLQPRYLGARVFDWLAIAKGAEGLFYPIRERSIRCDGLNAPPGTASLLDLPWVAEIAASNSKQVQAIWTDATALGLRQLPASELRVFLRYREIRSRSKLSFTAALSRIDLLKRLAPQPNEGTEEKKVALEICLTHARASSAGENKLLAALEILERDPRSLAPALDVEVSAFLAETLEISTVSQPELAARVLSAAARSGFADGARAGVSNALRDVHDTGDAHAWLDRFGELASALIDETTDVALLLQVVPPEARGAIVERWLRRTPTEHAKANARTALDAAQSINDLSVLPALTGFIAASELLDTAEVLVEHTFEDTVQTLARLVNSAGTDGVALWLSQRQTNALLPQVFVDAIVEALSDLATAASFIARTLPHDAAILVLAAYSARDASFDARSLLRANPDSYITMFKVVQIDPFRSGLDQLVQGELWEADITALIASFAPHRSETWGRAPWASDVVRRVLPVLVNQRLSGMVTQSQLHAWLAIDPSQVWLQTSNLRPLVDQLKNTRGEVALHALEILNDPATASLRNNAYIIRECLQCWGEQQLPDIIPLIAVWAQMLTGLSDAKTHVTACAISVRIAVEKHDPALAPLAEVAFATTHRELLSGASFGEVAENMLGALLGWSWDKAGRLREELARAWVYDSWPPLTLLRAAQGEEGLFKDLVREARDFSNGKRALRRLWEAARSAPDRDASWDRLLARLPSSIREE